jgi:AcrR family transcriptional regulator
MSDSTRTRGRLLEVAKRAGSTKPVVFHYFGDRGRLLVAVQTERCRRSMHDGLSAVADEAHRRCRHAGGEAERHDTTNIHGARL